MSSLDIELVSDIKRDDEKARERQLWAFTCAVYSVNYRKTSQSVFSCQKLVGQFVCAPSQHCHCRGTADTLDVKLP